MLKSPVRAEEQRLEIAEALVALRAPAAPAWIMARVAAMLAQYFTADLPQSVVAIQAEDWLEAQRNQPQWATTEAVRWWKSADNPDRKRRPLVGDIAGRVGVEMEVLFVADRAVQRQVQRPPAEPQLTLVPTSQPVSLAVRAAVLRGLMNLSTLLVSTCAGPCPWAISDGLQWRIPDTKVGINVVALCAQTNGQPSAGLVCPQRHQQTTA